MPKSITIEKVDGKPGQVYYPLKLNNIPTPTPGPHDLLVTIHAASLNHRDFFLRQHLYPNPSFSTPLLSDGAGVVTSIGSHASKSWLGKRVLLTPSRGWKDSPEGPENGKVEGLGGTTVVPLGTLQEVAVVSEDEVEEVPDHLSLVEAAALPLVGLTAWRALITKSGNAVEGRNVLITGIGGGVALATLQFAVEKGINVFVTSGSEEKLAKAMKLGATGGVSYKTEGWEKKLKGLLPKDRPFLDTIVDGAGGNIVSKATKLLKVFRSSNITNLVLIGVQQGGTIVQYGMTVSPKMDWSMAAVLSNIELRGTTMGSRKEFKDLVDFVREKKIKPVISRVVKGIENLKRIDELFEEMRDGKQFGKLVVEVKGEEKKKL